MGGVGRRVAGGASCDCGCGISHAALSDDEMRPNELLKLIAIVFARFVFGKYAKWGKYDVIWVGSEWEYLEFEWGRGTSW